MLKKYIKLSEIVVIVLLYSVSCFGQINNSAPTITFKSTSPIQISYSVQPLDEYGRATAPYQQSSDNYYKPRREGTRNLDTGEGDQGNGSYAPIGDIDFLTILLMFGLWFIYKKQSQNKQNSEIQIQNTLNLKDNKL